MKITPFQLRPALLLGALAALLSLGAGSRAPAADVPSQPANTAGSKHMWTLSIPPGVSPAAVQSDIVAVLNGRHWQVKEQAEGRVVGYLKHRGDEEFVTFVYTRSLVDLYCEGWKVDKSTGEREAPRINSRWMAYLQQDLNRLLYPLAPH